MVIKSLRISEEDLFDLDINHTAERLSTINDLLLNEKEEAEIVYYYKYRDLLQRHLRVLKGKQLGTHSFPNPVQPHKEPDAISVLSIHRLNCLLEEMASLNLSKADATRDLNMLFHLISSHLFNVKRTCWFNHQLNSLNLNEQATST